MACTGENWPPGTTVTGETAVVTCPVCRETDAFKAAESKQHLPDATGRARKRGDDLVPTSPVDPSLDLGLELPVADQYARFLELHALATAPGNHQVPLATLNEYQRLLTRFGVYTADGVFVGPPDPTRVPNSDPILNTDCIPIPGTKPLVCPRSSPKLPVELLSHVEERFRSLRLVGPDQTVLWVGRQACMETLCMYRSGCRCFAENAPSAERGGEREKLSANADTISPRYVTLDQMAATVSRSKRTLEKLIGRDSNPLPDPDIQGGGGKPNEWKWERIRPWLEAEYGRKLPAVFPGG